MTCDIYILETVTCGMKIEDEGKDREARSWFPSSCCIGGCVRNCALHLPSVFSNIQLIGSMFHSYHVVIAYDVATTDDSWNILQQIKRDWIPHMSFLLNVGEETTNTVRTLRIRHARNSILEWVRHRNNHEYLIMMDMDDVCSAPINLSILYQEVKLHQQHTSTWSALSFWSPTYYDIWALSLEPYLVSCWSWSSKQPIGQQMVDHMKHLLSHQCDISQHRLLPCGSAFHGFAIYHLDQFRDCWYDNSVCKNMEWITSTQWSDNVYHVRQDLNQENVTVDLRCDDCEHRHFHFQATQRHGAVIFICMKQLFG